MGCVRSGVVLAVAVAVAVLLLVLTPSSEAQAPLRITLDAPSTCEARIYYNAYLEVDSEPLLVDWRVTGGTAPYEVLINSEPYQGDSGQVSMTCRSLKPDTDVSGPITIQATVTDNAGRRASALADVYALRVYDRGLSKYSQDVLRPGETYRVHQLLLTMPLDEVVYLGNFQSADCERWGPDCDDRFNIWTTDGYPSSSLWIRRWTGTEYARTLEGEPFVRAEINEDELRYTKRADSRLFDAVLELIGQPPRRYQVTEPRSGPDDPNLKLRLYAPTYCVARGEHFNVLGVDVSWEIAGGRGPYEVTISGQRYLGQTGSVWVPCGPTRRLPDDWEGEPWPVQGTVVDANGRISSSRVDMYALPRPDRWADVENAESPAVARRFCGVERSVTTDSVLRASGLRVCKLRWQRAVVLDHDRRSLVAAECHCRWRTGRHMAVADKSSVRHTKHRQRGHIARGRTWRRCGDHRVAASIHLSLRGL